MRGPPGCGKSTAARSLLLEHLEKHGLAVVKNPGLTASFSPIYRAFILSTDDFCTHVDGQGRAEYQFNPKQLAQNHKRNQHRCELAMEIGLTPLFVDNTNIALWEMREYVKLADRFGYKIHVIDPRTLSSCALDPEILKGRCESHTGDRASGKSIGFNILQRMARNFEELPLQEDGSVALDAIRGAKAEWELREKLPLYAGLDTEAKAMSVLGSVQLSPQFWGGLCSGLPEAARQNYMDARCMLEGKWQLPDRLHVTVQFFGGRPRKEDIADAESLVGSWHEVSVDSVVYVHGGGLLCASCRLLSDGAAALHALAGESWYPHITLLTSAPWRPVDSTAVLRAVKEEAERRPVNATAVLRAVTDEAAGSTEDPTLTSAPSAGETQLDTVSDAPCAAVAALPTSAPAVATGGEATPAETELEVGKEEEEQQKREQDQEPAIVQESEAAFPLEVPEPLAEAEWDGRELTYRGVSVLDHTVDLSVIPLAPPLSLGPCQFRLFFRA